MMVNQETENQFERNKNLKALGITCVVTVGVFLIFFLVGWTIPQLPPEPPDQGVEVNLGNSDFGEGTIAPQVPGPPAESKPANDNPPPTARATAETEKEVIPNNDPNATPVNTSPKPVKKPPKAVENNVVKRNNPKPVVSPRPSPPRPKAVFAGGKPGGTGGNNADSYNNTRSQGIAGGKGDQGKPNGNPNSDSYTGNGGHGNGGITISSGLEGRRITSTQHFEDTYQHGGAVLVNVTVDGNGNVISAVVQLGSPFDDINRIAIKKAKLLNFGKGTDGQTGAIRIKFEEPKG